MVYIATVTEGTSFHVVLTSVVLHDVNTDSCEVDEISPGVLELKLELSHINLFLENELLCTLVLVVVVESPRADLKCFC